MRPVLLILGALIGAMMISVPAQAQNYPWCAYYSGTRGGGGTNCGFSTYAQCMADVSGIGGFCARNTMYVPPGAPHRRYHRRHRRHRY